MGKDYQLRKNYYFCLSFLSQSRTYWLTNFNKKPLLLLLEQIFCLVEMSFGNHLLLCLAIIVVSCRNKLLIENLTQLLIENLTPAFILASENHSLLFFQTLLPPKVTFKSNENIFFNESFIPASENLFSV